MLYIHINLCHYNIYIYIYILYYIVYHRLYNILYNILHHRVGLILHNALPPLIIMIVYYILRFKTISRLHYYV